MRLAADEGSLGTGLSLGGSVIVPLGSRWAIVRTASPEAFESATSYFSIRRTLIAPAIVRRWGSERLYGFAGGGFGAQIDRTHSRSQVVFPNPAQVEHRLSDITGNLLGRIGFVANPAGRLLIRADVELAMRHALPNVTGQIGLGWRF